MFFNISTNSHAIFSGVINIFLVYYKEINLKTINMATSTAITKGFKTIAILAIIWNIFGVMSFLMHAFMTPETIATLPENQQEFMNNTPAWRMICFGVATFGGLIASILLLFKNKMAVTLFALSFVAILLGHYYDIFMVKYYEGAEISGLILPFLIVAIGLFLFLYSRKKLT